MYSINPGLTAALTDDRLAELKRSAARCRAGQGRPARRSMKRATGWFLVTLGLRLALPRRCEPARRSVIGAAR
jgi:hypothetical protein